LAEIQKAVRHANLKVLVSLDPAAPDHSLATIEAGLAHDLTVEVDIIDGTSTHIESILEAFGLNRLKILANAIDDQWAVVAARGCSCHDPMSGWFIDHQYQTQICLSRDALGFLDCKRVRQLWLSPNAILQHQVGCPRSKMYSSDIWRSPTSQRRCGVSLGPPAQKVSVVVPSYGRSPKLIARTLNALLHQDYPKDFYDITLVDDGNPDDSVRAAVSICEEPSRIRYIRAIHGGAASARNHGIRASHGDIVVFTDDDCEPTSNWITDLVTGFFDDGIGGVGGRTVPRLQGNIIVRFLDQRRALRRFMVDKDSEEPDILPTANAAYRRTVLVEIGGFSEQFARMGLSYGGEDRDLTWRVIKAGHRISINLNAWVYHEHRSTLWQLIEQGYQYGRGCYVHCRIAGLPYDYEPRLLTLFRVFQEYLLPYVNWVRRYYREGASLGDSLVFPMLDFLRRFASAYGAYVTHKRWGYYHPNSAQIN
jgi:glycosyltransferase involved in cell wall biosynthesis